MKTQNKIFNAFNKHNKPKNENVFIPNHGVNDADRTSHFDSFDRDRMYKIKQIKTQ